MTPSIIEIIENRNIDKKLSAVLKDVFLKNQSNLIDRVLYQQLKDLFFNEKNPDYKSKIDLMLTIVEEELYKKNVKEGLTIGDLDLSYRGYFDLNHEVNASKYYY